MSVLGGHVEADVLGALDAGLNAMPVQIGRCRPGEEATLRRAPTDVARDLAAGVD